MSIIVFGNNWMNKINNWINKTLDKNYPFTIFHPVSPLPSGHCQSILCIYASVFTLFISLLYSLDFTCK